MPPPVSAWPRAIIFVGAGGIVRAAHLPAYRERGFEIGGVFDVEAKTQTFVDNARFPNAYDVTLLDANGVN